MSKPGIKSVLKRMLLVPGVGRVVYAVLCVAEKVAARMYHRISRYRVTIPPHPNFKSPKVVDAVYGPVLRYYRALGTAVKRLPFQPKISVIIPVHKVKRQYFWEALQSVAIQTYDNWEMCIVDDASNEPHIQEVIEDFVRRFPGKIKFSTNDRNLHISATSNGCIALATGDYCALLDHDDRLYPNAIGEMVRHINLYDQPDILYSDERVIDHNGNIFHDAFFKPDWSPFRFLSVNYTMHLSVYRLELLKKIGGFRVGYEGAQDYDIMLRMVEASAKPVMHVPLCLYQWRAHDASVASGGEAKPYAAIAAGRCIQDALTRRGRPGTVTLEPQTFHFKVRYNLPSPLPRVSIILRTDANLDCIDRCIDSIIARSTYENFEIIAIDAGPFDQRRSDLLSRFALHKPGILRVIRDERPLSIAEAINKGAKAADGNYLILLSGETEVKSADWIEEMLSLAQWPEVGAVGAKLLRVDDSIQQCGVGLLGAAIAGPMGGGASGDDLFYNAIACTIHEVAAVTTDCLMIRKETYFTVGGLDETWIPNRWGDVDFSIKLTKAGYSNVYTPYATLYRHESIPTESSLDYFEQFYLRRKYGAELLNDPYLHPAHNFHTRYQAGASFIGFDLPQPIFHWLLTSKKSLY